MGMFDRIKFSCRCPYCGATMNGFQSKDGDCNLDDIEFWEVDFFYASCKGCSVWVEFSAPSRPQPPRPIEDYEMSFRRVDDTSRTIVEKPYEILSEKPNEPPG